MTMNVNYLPDDCLLTIFNQINRLDTLINCSKVCSRWNRLITYRLRKVKYLMRLCETDDPDSTVYTDCGQTTESISLPNLKILGICVPACFPDCNDCVDCFKMGPNNQSVHGLIVRYDHSIDLLNFYFPKLRMIVFCGYPVKLRNLVAAKNLEQIHLNWQFLDEFRESIPYMVNLKRLHLFEIEYTLEPLPHLPSLKILEFYERHWTCDPILVGFNLMDACLSLQSAFIAIERIDHECYIDDSVKNEHLRDLVLEFCNPSSYFPWYTLRTLLFKFPNLEHLAVRGNNQIMDEDVNELVQILPKVKLLDFRRSRNVTSRSSTHLHEFCERSRRSITIYYDCEDGEPAEWPKIDGTKAQIVRGFDFMGHCFYRTFDNLPLIMDP